MKKNLIPESLLPLLELVFNAGREKYDAGVARLITKYDDVGDWLKCEQPLPEMDLEQVALDLLEVKNKDLNANICPCCGSGNINAGNFDPEVHKLLND